MTGSPDEEEAMPLGIVKTAAHVVEVEGALDVAAAARIRDAVLELDPGDPAVVDLHAVRELDDAALAFLAWSLSSRSGVELRGLGEHHRRLLRYLGVDSARAVVRRPGARAR